ncbi:hypothetical protein EAE96_007032 [Botrytis aclada]|nr:hypothetical protein EAE96_007032 [Botrytis aclada]
MFPRRVNPDKRKTRPWDPTPAVSLDQLPDAGREIVNQGRPKRVKRHESNEGFVLDYNRNRQTAQRYRGKGKAFTGDGEIGRRRLEPLSRLRPTPLSLWSDNKKPPQRPWPEVPSGRPGPPDPPGPPGPGVGRGITPAQPGPSAPPGPGTGRGRGVTPAQPGPSAPPGPGRGRGGGRPGITPSVSTKPDPGLGWPLISSKIDFWIPWVAGDTEWAKALARERQRDIGISAPELLRSFKVLNLPYFHDKFTNEFMNDISHRHNLSGDTGHPHWFFENMKKEYYGQHPKPFTSPSREEFEKARIERTTSKGQEAIIQRARKSLEATQEWNQKVKPSVFNTSLPAPPTGTTSFPAAPPPVTTTSTSGIGVPTAYATAWEKRMAELRALHDAKIGKQPVGSTPGITEPTPGITGPTPGTTETGRFPDKDKEEVADYMKNLVNSLITGRTPGITGPTPGTADAGKFPEKDKQEVADYMKNLVNSLITGSSGQVEVTTTTAPAPVNPLVTAPRPPQTSKPPGSTPAAPATPGGGLITGSSGKVDAKTTTAPAPINPFVTAPRPPQTSKPPGSIPAAPATPGGGIFGTVIDTIGGLLHGIITPSSNTAADAAAEVQKAFGPPNDLIVLPPTVKQNIPFHYVSDLHLEQTSYSSFDFTPRAPYLILAGDIGNTDVNSGPKYLGFLARMCAKPELKRVFLVAGNRDFWPSKSTTVQATIAMLRGFARHPTTLGKLVFMENERVIIEENGGKIVVLGCTLWTERLRGGNEPQDQSNAQRTARHLASCEWIRKETKKIRDDPNEVETRILIITHMPPSKSGTSPPEQTAKELRDFSTGASHGSDVIDGCKGHGYDHSSIKTTMPLLDWRDVWIWGHTHWNEPRHGKTRHGGMRFESNQRGNAHGIPADYRPKPPGAFRPEKIIMV